jgi:aminopeptidase N
VHLAYGGRLKNIPEFGTFPDQKQALDDQINSRLVELANYSSWYPQFFVMGSPLAVNLELSLPQAWTAVCSGRKLDEHVEDGRAITRWSSPNDTDILIAAAPNYKRKSRRVSETAIEMYYTQLPEEFIEKETRQIADVTKLFAGYLGETTIPAGTIKHVYSPMRKGQGRAGIARPGMIVTSEGRVMEELAKDPKFSLFQDVAHEIAHFWWNFGAGQGDWINEAFAEYFSAVALQKVLSQQQFDRVIENYRNEVRRLPANSPSLSTVPFDGSFFVVRYYKASLLLDHLRSALGDDRFFQASRNFFQAYRGKAIGTAEFRDFWRQRLGDQGKSLDRWLDSTGGLPELAQKQVTRHGNPGLEQMALGSLEVLTDVPADTSLLPP